MNLDKRQTTNFIIEQNKSVPVEISEKQKLIKGDIKNLLLERIGGQVHNYYELKNLSNTNNINFFIDQGSERKEVKLHNDISSKIAEYIKNEQNSPVSDSADFVHFIYSVDNNATSSNALVRCGEKDLYHYRRNNRGFVFAAEDLRRTASKPGDPFIVASGNGVIKGRAIFLGNSLFLTKTPTSNKLLVVDKEGLQDIFDGKYLLRAKPAKMNNEKEYIKFLLRDGEIHKAKEEYLRLKDNKSHENIGEIEELLMNYIQDKVNKLDIESKLIDFAKTSFLLSFLELLEKSKDSRENLIESHIEFLERLFYFAATKENHSKNGILDLLSKSMQNISLESISKDLYKLYAKNTILVAKIDYTIIIPTITRWIDMLIKKDTGIFDLKKVEKSVVSRIEDMLPILEHEIRNNPSLSPIYQKLIDIFLDATHGEKFMESKGNLEDIKELFDDVKEYFDVQNNISDKEINMDPEDIQEKFENSLNNVKTVVQNMSSGW